MVSLLFNLELKNTQFHFKTYKINNRNTSGNIPDCKRSFTFIFWGGTSFLEVLRYQVNVWSGQNKLLFQLLFKNTGIPLSSNQLCVEKADFPSSAQTDSLPKFLVTSFKWPLLNISLPGRRCLTAYSGLVMMGTHMQITMSLKSFGKCVGFVPVAVINTLEGRIYFITYCQVTVGQEPEGSSTADYSTHFQLGNLQLRTYSRNHGGTLLAGQLTGIWKVVFEEENSWVWWHTYNISTLN